MFSARKPKFAFDLSINELANIPQISGRCYIEIQIKDGKSMKPSVSKAFHRRFPSVNESEDDSSTSLKSGSTSTSASGNVFTTTASRSIHNFKCVFDYKLSCNLKFPIKRRENLIENKYLLLRVYYINEGDSSEVTELGRLEVNLSEYLNFKEPQTSKYLLKDSKVNSLLSLTIFLNELPSNFDFHTSLQVNESVSSGSLAHSSVASSAKAANPSRSGRVPSNSSSNRAKSPGSPTSPSSSHNKSSSFNIPQFESKNVFGGLNDVLQENTNTASGLAEASTKSPVLSEASSERSHSPRPHKEKGKPFRLASKVLPHANGHRNTADVANNNSDAQQGDKPLIMDPIVSRLYSKIMESTWDPELYALLEYTPEKSVSDILYSSDNPLGLNEKLSEKYISWTREKVVIGDDDDEDDLREVNGLLNEKVIREDLRSWTITSIV